MTNVIKKLLYEKGELSLTRVLAVAGFLAFLFGSFYLMWKGLTWGNYETFATMTGGGGLTSQLVNKFINSKYNSPDHEPYKKEEKNNGSEPA